MEELDRRNEGSANLPSVYRIEYWDRGWIHYCYSFETGKDLYMKVAKAKSPNGLANATKIDVRH